MKNPNVKLCIIFSLACINLHAQEQKPVVKKLKIQDVNVQLGMNIEINSAAANLSDFNKLAPNSILLKNDLTSYSGSNGFGFSGRPLFSTLLGIQLRDKEKTGYRQHPSFRLGITYLGGSSLSSSYSKTETKHYDTLISNKTGKAYYLDSINTKNYSMDYSSNQLCLDASYIYRTNPEARWSLFMGFGILAGISINSRTDIFYSNYTTTTNADGSLKSYDFNSSNYKFESFSNKNNITASAYIPMGVDFRLGNKRKFWKNTHLVYELRTGVAMTAVPELKTFANVGVQSRLGIKMVF